MKIAAVKKSLKTTKEQKKLMRKSTGDKCVLWKLQYENSFIWCGKITEILSSIFEIIGLFRHDDVLCRNFC